MVIQHNIMALNSYNRLGTNNSLLSKNLEKLSSGYKINRAGDNAAGLAISEKMRAQITGLEKATENAQDAISLVQTAEGAMTEIHSMLNRMVELATQSANGTYEDGTNRAFLQLEVKELQEEIDRIANNTNFNGLKLFTGTFTNKSFQVGPSAAEIIKLSIADLSFSNIQSQAQTKAGSTQAISVSDITSANKSIDVINAAIDFISEERSKLGAKQNRLEHTINNLTTTTENLTASESRIRDTDMAKEMMAYTKNNVLAQAAQAMLAQANQQPQMVLQLLQ